MMVKCSENTTEYLRLVTDCEMVPRYISGKFAWKCARIPTEEEEVQQVLF